MTTPLPPPPGDPPPAPAPGTGTGGFPESSNAVAALVLGIVGLVLAVACCPITSPIAWALGASEVSAIDAGRRDPQQRGLAVAGMIMGIIGTVLLGLALLTVPFLILFGGLSGLLSGL